MIHFFAERSVLIWGSGMFTVLSRAGFAPVAFIAERQDAVAGLVSSNLVFLRLTS